MGRPIDPKDGSKCSCQGPFESLSARLVLFLLLADGVYCMWQSCRRQKKVIRTWWHSRSKLRGGPHWPGMERDAKPKQSDRGELRCRDAKNTLLSFISDTFHLQPWPVRCKNHRHSTLYSVRFCSKSPLHLSCCLDQVNRSVVVSLVTVSKRLHSCKMNSSWPSTATIPAPC